MKYQYVYMYVYIYHTAFAFYTSTVPLHSTPPDLDWHLTHTHTLYIYVKRDIYNIYIPSNWKQIKAYLTGDTSPAFLLSLIPYPPVKFSKVGRENPPSCTIYVSWCLNLIQPAFKLSWRDMFSCCTWTTSHQLTVTFYIWVAKIVQSYLPKLSWLVNQPPLRSPRQN